jgi:hypothetical protein
MYLAVNGKGDSGQPETKMVTIYCKTKNFNVCFLSCKTCSTNSECNQYEQLKMSEQMYEEMKATEINII